MMSILRMISVHKSQNEFTHAFCAQPCLFQFHEIEVSTLYVLVELVHRVAFEWYLTHHHDVEHHSQTPYVASETIIASLIL